IKWLKKLENIESMHLMLQKEVAQRIEAKVNHKHYGRLSVISNLFCKTKIIFEVPPTIFIPPPKVVSAIIELVPYHKIMTDFNFDIFEKIVASAFNQRRKMIRSSLKPIFNNVDEVLGKLNIDSSLRAENITIEQFIKISQYFL
ncbi:MAG: 16S rRNA (adenine(1518)-N(6)/adenine(1519)-N(6))-dimethyltransferase, partial [Rickettsiales bacterium]|nr:16S rRNA (adenine(1518)-N(6)/adenine(1519)-N(6))-dimethyltransferase [Rickettsiales bacterium]